MRRTGRLRRRAKAECSLVNRTPPDRHRQDSRARPDNQTSRLRTSPRRARARAGHHPLSRTRAARLRRKARPPVKAAHRAAALRPASRARAARATARRLRRRVRAQASRRHRSPSHRLTISHRPRNNSKGLKELGPASAGPLFCSVLFALRPTHHWRVSCGYGRDANAIMIPISRKIMMSLECSITKAIMESH
jgi:hypothetical protein